jgi:putative ABC transport system permease protein
LARLAPGATVGAACAEIESITRALMNKNPQQLPGLASDVHPLLDDYGRYANRPLFIAIFVAVGFVLLIACADVANLLLARAAARGREISIRIAIGAARARIIRQLLIESVLLASLGGFFGWLLALGTLRWFDRATAQAGRPSWQNFSMDAKVFAYLAFISIATGVLFGLAPALRLAKVDVNSGVKDGGNAATGGVRGRRLANALVAFEMLLAAVLLAGAGLLIRSSMSVYGAPVGVNPVNVLAAHINLPEAKYPRAEDEISFHRELARRLGSLPEVESVAIASAIPVLGYGVLGFSCGFEDGSQAAARGIVVDSNYFRVMQVRPTQGGFFDDSANDQAVVNKAFAAKYWPGQDTAGRRLRQASGWINITGVIPDIIQGRQLADQPLIYVPYRAMPRREMFVIARTVVPPATLGEAFRREVQKLDENLPLYDVQTLESRIARQRMETGSLGVLFTIFAAVALVLATVGLYAVIAHGVSQRTREIGLRIALGGSRCDILWLALAQGMWPVAIGLALGLLAAVGLTRGLRSALVGVSPADPITFAGVIVLLALIGVLGCAVPARRALRVDPVIALRYE